jgi:hypothetical protein
MYHRIPPLLVILQNLSLKKVMNSTVKQLKDLLHDQPENPLRPNQVEEFKEERERLQSIVKAPAWQTGADRGSAQKRFRQIDKYLEQGAPKPLDQYRRDKVNTLAKEALNEIRDAMLPQSAMRRNPAGAVDHYRRNEGSKEVKEKILTWKRAMRALDPDNTDQDYTNIERFRPQGTPNDGTSTFVADAQIPGKFAQSPLAKENWPLGEPKVDTAVAQVKRREMSEEAKQAARERLARAREIKAAKSNPIQHVPVSGEGVTDDSNA